MNYYRYSILTAPTVKCEKCGNKHIWVNSYGCPDRDGCMYKPQGNCCEHCVNGPNKGKNPVYKNVYFFVEIGDVSDEELESSEIAFYI